MGVLGAIVALEQVLAAAPGIANSVSDLVALMKRGASGGPPPTAEEIAAAQSASRDKIQQIQDDIDAG